MFFDGNKAFYFISNTFPTMCLNMKSLTYKKLILLFKMITFVTIINEDMNKVTYPFINQKKYMK